MGEIDDRGTCVEVKSSIRSAVNPSNNKSVDPRLFPLHLTCLLVDLEGEMMRDGGATNVCENGGDA
jgi:hypothetical protein